jgi:peptidyl-prolyl cis-trans isomerase C
MIHAHRVLAVLAVGMLAAACNQKPTAPAAKVDNVATINGKSISRVTFNEFAKNVAGKPAEDLTPEQRKDLVDNLVRAVVVADEADASGISARDETRFALDMARLQILQRAVSQNYLKDRKPSEEELRAEFNLRVGAISKLRYRASHILVPTEDAAKQLIAQLQNSTDAASKDKGGDLDWFTPETMTPAFAAAVTKLKKGELTATPVQTPFGWHVIRLTDTADNPPPPYESVKDRLVQMVEEKKFRAYVDTLMTKSKVEVTP